jgi:hypothetical protein
VYTLRDLDLLTRVPPGPVQDQGDALVLAGFHLFREVGRRLRQHLLVFLAFSFCWWACRERTDVGSPLVVVLKDAEHPSSATDEAAAEWEAKTEPPLSWPQALRKVRSQLQPWIMLWRYWQAFSDRDAPEEDKVDKVLLDRLFSVEGFYLYASEQQTYRYSGLQCG